MIAKTRRASRSMAAFLAATMVITSNPIDASAAKAPAWKAKKTSLTVGKASTFQVKNVPSKGTVTFSSSKKTVATVKKTGTAKAKVTAKKAGKTEIKAVVKNKKKKKVKTLKVTLTVKAKKVKATATPKVTPTVAPTASVTPTATTNVQPTTNVTATASVAPTTAPTGVVDPTAQPTTNPNEGVDKVVDKVTITAVGRTWVEIAFPDAIDSSATAENFKITTDATDIAATVNAAHWSTGYKTVKLNVTGLQYGLKYTVSFNGLKSAGVNYPVDSLTFNASTVEEAWVLQIVPERNTLTADGQDNMKVTFNLVDSATGVVDPNADEIVLDLAPTYGNFQTTDLVLQDGTGTAVLRSDFFPVTTSSKIHVEVKETSNEYKFLKGAVSADYTITMEAKNYSTSGEAVLTKAESGQADRITLNFDKDVNVASFVEYNKSKKEYKTEWVPASEIGWDAKTTDPNVVVKDGVVGYERQLFIDTKKSSVNFKVTQNVNGKTIEYPVVGMNTIEGATNKLELVLHEAMPLDDNNTVYVTYENKKADILNNKDFNLTDVTPPKFVSATSEGLKRVVVKFSEPIPALKNRDQKVNNIFNVEAGSHYKFSGAEFGTFNPATLEDTRNSVVLTLDKNDKGEQQYFQEREGVDDSDSYNYQIAITNVVDFAGTKASDKENIIEANQDNKFKVTGDTRKPEATVTVESPEQFRVSFNCPVVFEMAAGENLSNVFQKAFRVNNGAKTGFVNMFVDGKYKVSGDKILGDQTIAPTLSAAEKQFFNVTPLRDGKEVASTEAADEFVVELTQDWTKVYKTSSSNKNYYNDTFEFKFAEQTITNDDNGWKNKSIELDLNYAASTKKEASPLNKSDLASPAILDIQETSDEKFFTVVMNEPIQYDNTKDVETKATNTYSETNTKLNAVVVNVEGTDPAGKEYSFNGIFRGYDKDADKTKTDTMLKLEIVDNSGRTLQDLVDEGYGNDWKVILHYPYDDVLNAADTVYKVFTVEPSEDNVFEIANVEGVVGTADGDVITVTFTKGVATNSAALKPASWTINGTKLASAPIMVVQNSGTAITGYRSITITLPAGTLTAGKSAMLGVDQTITSVNDIVLTGEHELSFVPVNGTTTTPVDPATK